jgi:hypothetical protein
MGKMAYALRLLSGLGMVVAVPFGCVCFDRAVAYLGHPVTDNSFLGILTLVAFAGFLLVFLAAGAVWMLGDISEQLSTRKR